MDEAADSDGVVIRMPSGPRSRRGPARLRGTGAPDDDAAVVRLPGAAEVPAPLEAPAVPEASPEPRLAAAVEFLRRRLAGDYRVDEFGFDPEFTDAVALPLLRTLYRRWFRVEVNGVENLPATGGALLVANHAGGLGSLDAMMTAVAVHDEHAAGRHLRVLGSDVVFRTPGLGPLARRTGASLACHPDAERLLRAGELVGVWPEGARGSSKPFRDRYQLQRFGRSGFVEAAIAARVPIIAVSIVGAEETHPVLRTAPALARILNLPHFPLTPTFPWLGPLGLVPLPSKWYLEFSEAILPSSYPDQPDTTAVFELADQVRETIQASLYRLLVQRRSAWR